MSSLFDDPDSPTDLPSYEYSVTEKAPPSSRPPARVVDEDGWLIYDAGAFEAAANAASASASVSVSSRQSTLSRSRPSMMKVRVWLDVEVRSVALNFICYLETAAEDSAWTARRRQWARVSRG